MAELWFSGIRIEPGPYLSYRCSDSRCTPYRNSGCGECGNGFKSMSRMWMVSLGANLAQAAALCWAFELGDDYAQEIAWTAKRTPWFPGCGRSVL